MPTYSYHCKDCDTSFDKLLKLADIETPQACPKCATPTERHIGGAPGFGDPMRMGRMQPSDAFKDLLRNVHAKTPGSVLKDNSSFI
jgi:putative FmdB family regulatory protein